MPDLTVAIATYQRRESVARLVRTLADQVRLLDEPERVEILVVVDGSDDGTTEALGSLRLPVPARVVSQPNAGLARTRDRSLGLATAPRIWFLDDDVVPAPGTLQSHLAWAGRPDVVMGPCLLPLQADTLPVLRSHYDRLYGELARAGRVTRFDQFSAANTSAPVALLRDMGGFHAGFGGYGREDFELGIRLLEAGVVVRFDGGAVVWHHQRRTIGEYLANAESEGANSVEVSRLHPGTLDEMIPDHWHGRFTRLVWRLGIRSRDALRLVGAAMGLVAGGVSRLGRDGSHLLELAYRSCFAAGVAAADPSGRLVARLLTGTERPPRAPDERA